MIATNQELTTYNRFAEDTDSPKVQIRVAGLAAGFSPRNQTSSNRGFSPGHSASFMNVTLEYRFVLKGHGFSHAIKPADTLGFSP
jgi:hypothetical protein